MSGRVSVRQTLEAKVSLSSGFHHQTNGQCERANHNLEVSFRCPSGAWPPRTSRTGAYSFPGWNMRITRCHLLLPVCLPLYVPLVTYRRYFLSRREMWGFRQWTVIYCDAGRFGSALGPRSSIQRRSAGKSTPGASPEVTSQVRVWLAAGDIPLMVESRKLARRYIELEIINPAAVRLKLPESMKIHPIFHFSAEAPSGGSSLPTCRTPSTHPGHRWTSGF